ncbi:MAG: hypothetical protein KDH17_12350 [Rhodocyclaceae bacterium]|nr:hypothetical protein [Rhodocyclaceae bacterium]
MGEFRRIQHPYPFRRLIAYLLAAAVGLGLMLDADVVPPESGTAASTNGSA